MKITSVSTTALSLPVPSRYSSQGAGTKREWGRLRRITARKRKRVLEYLIVRVETDEGLVGLGEAATDIGFFGELLEKVKSAIDFHMGPRIIGRDPFDREETLRQLDFRGIWMEWPRSGAASTRSSRPTKARARYTTR